MGEKILIVEDDKKLNDGIRLALKNDSCLFYQWRSLKALQPYGTAGKGGSAA